MPEIMGPTKSKQNRDAEKGEVDHLESARNRNASGKSYGSTTSDGTRKRHNSERFARRMSVTSTTDKPFERRASVLRRQSSSGASIRTRLASVPRSEYHKDLKQDLDSGVTWQLVLGAFIIVLGSSYQFGYNIGVLNNPKPLIIDFYNETYTNRSSSGISDPTLILLWSFTNAIFIPGGMIGAFLGGWLADKLGRKKSILFSHIFAILGAALGCACEAARAPELLMLARFLFGINSGIGNCIAPMFLSEIAPYNLRGAFGTVHQLAITIGIFMGSVYGLQPLLGQPGKWPFLLLLEALPAITSLIVLPFLKESPRFLLLVKRERDQAEESLQFYRGSEDVITDMEEMDTEELNDKKHSGTAQITLLSFIKSADLRKPLIIACMLQVVQQLSGINAVFFYSNGIFRNAKVPEAQIPYAVIGTNAVNVAMTIISVPLMDKAGRRLLMLIPMVVMVADLVLITIALNTEDKVYWMVYISILCIILYVICFAVGLGPIPMMIGAELFRQGPRPYAMAVAGVANWIFTFIIAIGFESLQSVLKDYTFVFFLVLMILFTLYVYFFVPETKNKTFEEIAHQFSPGTDLEVEECIEDEADGDDVFGDKDANVEGDGEEHRLVTLDLSKRKGSEGDGGAANGGDGGKKKEDGVSDEKQNLV